MAHRFLKRSLALAAVTLVALALALPLGWLLVWVGGVVGLAIYLSLLCLALAALGVPVITSLFSAPYVPVNEDTLAEMIRLAELREDERFYDLGSGDGCILFAAARAGARTEGWEINPYLCLWTWLAARWYGLSDRVKVHCGSYWSDSYSSADVISLYLLPHQMRKMEDKLLRELHPGARVIAADFRFPNWKPSKESGGARLYVVPPKS